MRRFPRRIAAGIVVLVALLLPVVATAGQEKSTANGLKSLPKSVQALYVHANPQEPTGPSPLVNFKPKHGPPWVIGYSSEYAGNNWRSAALNRLNKVLLPQYKKAGLVKKVIVTQSNLNNQLQIQQIKQLVDQGVDAIITCCAAPTVLNGAIKYAWNHHVPFFVYNGYVTSPYAVSELGNYYVDGQHMGEQLFQAMGGKGNVLDVAGFPGITSNDNVEAGMRQVAKTRYPGIKIIGSVTSQDTDPIAKNVVLQFLASHPGSVDGVFTQSPGEVGVLQALLQSGRGVPPIVVGGESGTACYWKQHPSWVKAGLNTWPPGDEFQAAWEIMMRTLEGQGPKIQSMHRPLAPFKLKDVASQLPAKCDTNGNLFLEPPAAKYFPSSLMDKYFTHPANPLKYKG
ncbi:MAG TPA: substrate-binding domain-containing protein [Gaiellaceae bacterium]